MWISHLVLCVHSFPLLLVLICISLSVLHHSVDLIRRQGGGARDLDVLLLAGALVGRADAQDTVGIDVELDLNLGDAPGGGGDAVQPEVSDRLVVPSKLTLSYNKVSMSSSGSMHAEVYKGRCLADFYH